MGWDWRKWFGFPEKRAITAVPWQSTVPFNVGPSAYGGDVNESMALRLGVVFAAVRLLAQSISTLPVKCYRKGAEGEARIPMPTLPQLFQLMVDDGTLVPWLHRCVVSLALRGNAYGLIISRDGYQFPTQIEWLDPTAVAEDTRQGEDGWLYNGRPVPREQIVHIPWFPVPGGRVGLSPIGSYAQSVGLGLKAQDYAHDWFNAGGFPPGTFKNMEQTVDPTSAAEIKARLTN